ncbi:putative Laccase [Seiridium unicorne]|uniref:Laccase n=1 Tax=Seiridium unicorne TaxID=138068 RepID=A0ABR2UFD5_9PEZI
MVSFIAKLTAGALPLSGGLSPEHSHGKVVDYQALPDFLGDSALSPWGSTAYNGDTVRQNPPDTGVTRHYDFNIARAKLAPDGYDREMIVVNEQYPGPLIEANWGDWVEITVTNNITEPEEGTTIHWHALLQKGTPYYDGVPGVSQCPIAPGERFTYRFRADHVGTTFYHSHYSAQISAGVSGPIVFHGPKSQKWDYDVGPVLLSDWFHREYFEIVEGVMGNGTNRKPAISDNNLINGKMNFDCSRVSDGTPCVSNAGVSKFKLKPGKDNLLRVINGGSAGLQYFSVDDHLMTVIAMDFIPIKPYTTNVITLGVGQRSDVIIHGKSGNLTNQAYWIRSNISTLCALPSQPHGLAALYYSEDASNAGVVPTSQAQIWNETSFGCANVPLALTQPLNAVPVKQPDTTITINVLDTLNATGHDEYLLNNQTFRADYNLPVLKAILPGNTTQSLDPNRNVVQTGNSKVFRIVWENQKFDPSNPKFYNLTFAHPMHLHGHDYQVLAAGPGQWDGNIETGLANALRRDTHILPPNGHLVVQFETDNPGVWPFHCHVAWHVSAGFNVNILERARDLVKLQHTAKVMDETCKAWDAWTAVNIANQIDSGLKLAMLKL